MKVRCGACQTEFEVPGAGRYSCPSCGTANDVGGGRPPPPSSGGPGPGAPGPPVAAPEVASPPPVDVSRVQCPDCSFSFLVGEVAAVPCPNCGAEVEVGGAS